ICVFCFMWNDRKRKKYYIALQHELTQKRVDTMLLKDEEVSESNKEHIDKKRSELTEQQIQLCVSVLKTTDCYDQLETLEKATPKQLLAMRSLRKDIRSTISNAFVDVMVNLKERYPTLTGDDVFYCVLSLLYCSKTVMMELMDAILLQVSMFSFANEMTSARRIRLKNKTEVQHRSIPVTPDACIENSLLSIDLLSTVPTVTVIIKNAETDEVVYTSTDLNVDKVYIDLTGEEKGKYTL
uniref:DUF3244 domain-containing protein n=1 Tax=Phocaeicola sp. RTP21198st1_B8_RTP21198_201120 TaxID=3143217 RepID=UPI0034A1225D